MKILKKEVGILIKIGTSSVNDNNALKFYKKLKNSFLKMDVRSNCERPD